MLATVARHYGKRVSVAWLRDVSGSDLRGSNLLGLQIAADKIGFEATAVRAQWEDLAGGEPDLPVIAHVLNDKGLGHFVVVHRVRSDSIVVADPASGVESWPKEKFLRRWRIHRFEDSEEVACGVVMLLTPMTDAELPPDATSSSYRRLWQIVQGHLPVLRRAFLCASLAALLALGTSFFVQFLVDVILPQANISLLNVLGIGFALIILFRTGFTLLRQYLLVDLAQRIELELRLGCYGHLLRLPMRFFRSHRVGEVLARINDARSVRFLIQGTTISFLLDATMLLFAFGILLAYDAKLSLFVLGLLSLFGIVLYLLRRPVRRIERRLMEEVAELDAHLVESVSGIGTLKPFGAEGSSLRVASDLLLKVFHSRFDSAMLQTGTTLAATVLSSLAVLAVLWYGGHLVLAGNLSLGQLMFFTSILGFLVGPLERMSDINIRVQEALIALDRLSEILDLQPEQPAADADAVAPTRVAGEFVLEGVSFSYGHRRPVLRDIDLRIPAGATVALVGETGSGKTTLANLLARFDDPSEGRIFLDGLDLARWGLRELRKIVGLVPQETVVFRGKVRDNIALGRPEANGEEIEAAARKADAHDFISRLPDGYESLVGERGSDLSSGERQRLAIARALLSDPKILILDEATSNLDSETEHVIQQTIQEVARERTTVLIAHRLSTVMRADNIVVLHDGAVLEQGTHRELMRRRGKYFAMWQRQFPPEIELEIEAATG